MLGDALDSGRLTGAQREIVALAVGQANKCQYCLSAHTLMGKGAGLDDGHIMEVIGNVAHNTLTNYTNHIAQTEIDFPLLTV